MSDSGILRDYVDILYRIHLRLLKNENKRVRTLYTDFHVDHHKLRANILQRRRKVINLALQD